MKKSEFLYKLTAILEKNQITDAEEIIEEYEQHFAFKMADGYSEEEIAAKLGDPEQIAMQYERNVNVQNQSAILTKIGLGFADVFAVLLFLLIAACGVVIGVAAIAFAVAGLCMIVGASPYSLIPSIPYWCGAILGVALVALGVLAAVGCVYYWAIMKQLLKSFGRFQHNTIAAATGKPVLPSLPVHAQLSPKTNRRLRSFALVGLLTFAVCFILGFIACALSAESIQFWHTWGWFA